jgi:hypothetical protein
MLVDWPVTGGDNRKGGQGTNDHAHEGVFAYQDFYVGHAKNAVTNGGHERIENPEATTMGITCSVRRLLVNALDCGR